MCFYYRREHLELLLPGVSSECLTAFRAKKLNDKQLPAAKKKKKRCYIKNNSWCGLVYKYCKGLFTQRKYSAWIFNFEFKNRALLWNYLYWRQNFACLWKVFPVYSWTDLLSDICVTSAFCSCCEQDLMLYPNTHLPIFIFSTQRSDDCGSRLHCQTTAADHRFTRAKTCMFAETQSTLTHFDLSHWSASSEKSPVLYNILQLYSDFWQFEWTWRALIGSVWSVKDMNKPIKRVRWLAPFNLFHLIG